ncbi:MAG: hypothetical protein O3B90_03270 [Actinomycetota bacterium]|jgi:hypothetical protein|uniref:hypothetical protein n=1 Tax=uncultured Ilumatobacter sp. TaxID=879968 RepID=UPI00374F450D|nr:hypothetical protein [Actinomycetota bacterium]
MGTLADHQLRSNRDRLIGVGPVLIGLHDEVFDCLSEIVVFEPFGLAEKECYEASELVSGTRMLLRRCHRVDLAGCDTTVAEHVSDLGVLVEQP